MGFLSDIGHSIGKGLKNVFKGIMKVFEPILKPLSKLMSSGLGKAIMLGLSVFTLGTAMVAGWTQFANSTATSWIARFVEGGEAFLSSITGVGAKDAASPTVVEKSLAMGDQTQLASLTGSANPGLISEASALEGIGNINAGLGGEGTKTLQAVGDLVSGSAGGNALPDAMAGGAATAGPTKAMAEAGSSLATRTPPPVENKGWLEKAKDLGGKFVDYSKTPGGSQVVGSLVQGVGNYYTEKDRQNFEDRVRKDWMKGDKSSGVQSIREQTARASGMRAPDAVGIASQSRETANQDRRRPYFGRAYGATAGG